MQLPPVFLVNLWKISHIVILKQPITTSNIFEAQASMFYSLYLAKEWSFAGTRTGAGVSTLITRGESSTGILIYYAKVPMFN